MLFKGFPVPIGLWFLHFFVRPIWSTAFNLFWFFPRSVFLVVFSKKHRDRYKQNRKEWKNIKKISDLTAYFQRVDYVWDGHKGIFDHDNWHFEFFLDGYDCDDAGRIPYNVIKNKKLSPEVYWVGMVGDKIKSWHYDCLFMSEGYWYLFNQGHPVQGRTVYECFGKLSAKFVVNGWRLFPLDALKVWNAKKLISNGKNK